MVRRRGKENSSSLHERKGAESVYAKFKREREEGVSKAAPFSLSWGHLSQGRDLFLREGRKKSRCRARSCGVVESRTAEEDADRRPHKVQVR